MKTIKVGPELGPGAERASALGRRIVHPIETMALPAVALIEQLALLGRKAGHRSVRTGQDEAIVSNRVQLAIEERLGHLGERFAPEDAGIADDGHTFAADLARPRAGGVFKNNSAAMGAGPRIELGHDVAGYRHTACGSDLWRQLVGDTGRVAVIDYEIAGVLSDLRHTAWIAGYGKPTHYSAFAIILP